MVGVLRTRSQRGRGRAREAEEINPGDSHKTGLPTFQGSVQVASSTVQTEVKNTFEAVHTTEGDSQVLNVPLPQALNFTEITALVPFSTARLIATIMIRGT
jgi:hypothetical protein